MTLVGFDCWETRSTLTHMMQMIPISALTTFPSQVAEPISCAICQISFACEDDKLLHIEAEHPNWAFLMMTGYLRQVPRENG